MAKRFLQAQGLPRGAGDSIQELSERIVRYREAGTLTDADIGQLLRELAEYGEKRVFVTRGSLTEMRAVGPGGFAGKAVTTLDGVRIKQRPSSPHLNYALVTAQRIRLSFSETHQFRKVLWQEDTVVRVSATVVVVIDAYLATGTVTLAFDRPGQHAHGATPSAFFDYYIQNEVPGLLGTDLEPFEFYDLLHAAAKEEYRDIVKPGIVRGLGDDGCAMSLGGGQGATDLRDYATYQTHSPGLVLRNNARLTWKATHPKPQDMTDVREGRALIRDVTTFVVANPAMVRFDKHTLSHEMAYVLRKIDEIT